MINLSEELKTFENDVCGGYKEYIEGKDEYSEIHIGDFIEEKLKEFNIDQYKINVTHAFDSPGVDVSILSVAYVSEGEVELKTFELITC